MEKSHLFPTLCFVCLFVFFTVLVFPGIFLACCARLFLFCHHHISLSCLPYISCYLADFVTVYKCFLYPVWKQSNSSSFAPLQLLIILCFAMLQNAFVLWLLILLAMLRFFKKKKKKKYILFPVTQFQCGFFFFFICGKVRKYYLYRAYYAFSLWYAPGYSQVWYE